MKTEPRVKARGRPGWVLAILLACAVTADLALISMAAPGSSVRIEAFAATARRIAPLHVKKKPPGPDDWLANHDEPGQTFEQYRKTNPKRPTKKHTAIYVQPIGEFSATQKKLTPPPSPRARPSTTATPKRDGWRPRGR